MQQTSGSNQGAINGIHCDVSNCYYHNKGGKCVAKEITVGPQYANSSADTVCATFKPGQDSGASYS